MPEHIEVTRAAERGFMRFHDVGAYLGVSRQRVDQLSVKEGSPGFTSIAGHRMWERKAIEGWAEQQWVGFAALANSGPTRTPARARQRLSFRSLRIITTQRP